VGVDYLTMRSSTIASTGRQAENLPLPVVAD